MMKNRIVFTALIAGVLAMGSAHAKTPSRADALFARLDANHDGQLSADELARMRQVRHEQTFAKADTNGDGKIEQSEFMAASQKRAEHGFQRLDTNHDGAIETSEMKMPHHRHWHHRHHRQADGQNWMMKKMDTDANGVVSQAEFETALARWHQKHGGMDSSANR